VADWPAAKSNKCDATKSEILNARRISAGAGYRPTSRCALAVRISAL
jgi:hypothetical protein